MRHHEWTVKQFNLLLSVGEDDTKTLSYRLLFPTTYSVHTLQIKRRPTNVKRIAVGCCFTLFEDIELQNIYPTELNDPIHCGNCTTYEQLICNEDERRNNYLCS